MEISLRDIASLTAISLFVTSMLTWADILRALS